jgi:hypothetical protein
MFPSLAETLSPAHSGVERGDDDRAKVRGGRCKSRCEKSEICSLDIR